MTERRLVDYPGMNPLHIKGTNNIADYLSRCLNTKAFVDASPIDENAELNIYKVSVERSFNEHINSVTPSAFELNELVQEKNKDPQLVKVREKLVAKVMPSKDNVFDPFRRFWDTLSVSQEGILTRDDRIIIPKAPFFANKPYRIISKKGSIISARSEDGHTVTRNESFFKHFNNVVLDVYQIFEMPLTNFTALIERVDGSNNRDQVTENENLTPPESAHIITPPNHDLVEADMPTTLTSSPQPSNETEQHNTVINNIINDITRRIEEATSEPLTQQRSTQPIFTTKSKRKPTKQRHDISRHSSPRKQASKRKTNNSSKSSSESPPKLRRKHNINYSATSFRQYYRY